MPLSLPSLSMDLSDEGLGPLTLHALNGAGVVHLKLTAADPAVGNVLSRAAGDLRRDLEASGTNVGTLEVGHSASGHSTGSSHTSSGHPSGGHAGTNSGLDRRRPLSAPAAIAPSTRSHIVTDGVDVRI
jgi:hypothetical protein